MAMSTRATPPRFRRLPPPPLRKIFYISALCIALLTLSLSLSTKSLGVPVESRGRGLFRIPPKSAGRKTVAVRGGEGLERLRSRLPDDVARALDVVKEDLPKKARIDKLAQAFEPLGESKLILIAAQEQVRVPRTVKISTQTLAKALAKRYITLSKKDCEKKQLVSGDFKQEIEKEEEMIDNIDTDAFFDQLTLEEKLGSLVETSVGAGGPEEEEIPRARALMVGVDTMTARRQGGYRLEESLDELRRLSESAGLRVVGRISQKMSVSDPRTYVGEGKLEELVKEARRLEVEAVLFNDELTPGQLRNLERELEKGAPGARPCDRTALILDIFDQRATTQEAKLQVRLAQTEYQLPRLTRMWTHLERQKGGGGGGGAVKGMGETQLEVDKRILRKRVSRIKTELSSVRDQRAIYRERRSRHQVPVIALVGYSNAGKSTLLNALSTSGQKVSAKDNLFETLDPVTRKINLPYGQEVLLTDTVGFVERLPSQLVAAFQATLEEIKFADLILHVVDSSSPSAADQFRVTKKVLRNIGADKVETLTVANKLDRKASASIDPENGTETYQSAFSTLQERADTDASVGISALTGEGLDDLLSRIQDALTRNMKIFKGLLPYEHTSMLDKVRTRGALRSAVYTANGIVISAQVGEDLAAALEDVLIIEQ